MILKRYVCMEQDSCNVGIIGAGPAGCACAYFIKNINPYISISIIDYSNPLRTILPTGGGRCNLAHAEYDFKELAKNYPRGEKFLYSVFSRFSTCDTLELFERLGIPVYTQDDNRIFPKSNSSKEVRQKFLKALDKVMFIKEKALRIELIGNKFKVITDLGMHSFDKLVFAAGSHNGFEIIKRLGISTVEPKPSLTGYVSAENFSTLMGTVHRNVYNYETGETGDILFTHFGVSGPLIYKISSIKARDEYPFILHFDLNKTMADLQELLNDNPHKYIKNLLSEYIPQKLAIYILKTIHVAEDTKCHAISGKIRNSIESRIHNFNITIKTSKKDGETVNAGGVCLDKIESKTMESKEIRNLYFCGEAIDVDGFCGGFNLQNCWSTAYITASAIA